VYRTRGRYKVKNKFEEKINSFLSMVLIIIVIPVFIVTLWGKVNIEELMLQKSKDITSPTEVLLPEIVAKQIGIHMPKEAIKAQTVIARTQILAAEKRGEILPVGFSVAELQELWGEQFEQYYKLLQELIEETAGETLQYNGEYIYAAYHQVSAGNTRNMTEYYDKSKMPYLTSAACHEDSVSEGYLNVFFWSKDEFLELCKYIFPEEIMNGGGDLKILKRDSAGYVLEVQVGQTVYEGENFRKKMSLPSACFDITLIEDDVRIVTMGQGHGFGLSQHMAGYLAEEGMGYKEILQYFYKGVAIVE